MNKVGYIGVEVHVCEDSDSPIKMRSEAYAVVPPLTETAAADGLPELVTPLIKVVVAAMQAKLRGGADE